MEQLTIIEGILSVGEFNLCAEKAEIQYQGNENSLMVEINFHNSSEYFEFEVAAVPVELSEEEKDLIYDTLKEAHTIYLNDAEQHYMEWNEIQEDNLEMILTNRY